MSAGTEFHGSKHMNSYLPCPERAGKCLLLSMALDGTLISVWTWYPYLGCLQFYIRKMLLILNGLWVLTSGQEGLAGAGRQRHGTVAMVQKSYVAKKRQGNQINQRSFISSAGHSKFIQLHFLPGVNGCENKDFQWHFAHKSFLPWVKNDIPHSNSNERGLGGRII